MMDSIRNSNSLINSTLSKASKQAILFKKRKIEYETLSREQKLGKVLEEVFKPLFNKATGELGLSYKWAGKDAYLKGLTNEQKHKPDFEVYYGTKQLIAFECKNVKRQYGHDYPLSFARDNITYRFEDWFGEAGLIVSFYDQYNQTAQAHIESVCKDNIIDVGKLVGNKDHKNRQLKFDLAQQLKSLIQDALTRHKQHLKNIQTQLTDLTNQLTNQLTQNNQIKFELQSGDSFFSMLSKVSNVNSVSVDNTVTTVTNQLNQTNNNTPNAELSNSYNKQDKKVEIDDLDFDKEIDKAKKLGLYNDYGFSS